MWERPLLICYDACMVVNTRCVAVAFLLSAGLMLSLSVPLVAQTDELERIDEATDVLNELAFADDGQIPASIREEVQAVAVFPGTIKAGFIIGGHRGRGIISAVDEETGEWSLPAFLTLTGGSFGLQIGAQSVDVVLLIMNRGGLERFLSNQFTIGADASVAAGPVGRDAQAATDIQLRAEILGYSRSRGLFAGMSLEGTSIHQDRDANERIYGFPYRTQAIVLESEATPPDEDIVAGWQEWLTTHLWSVDEP